MKPQPSPIWWLPLLRRVVRWGAVGALGLNLLPWLVVTCVLLQTEFQRGPLWDNLVLSGFLAAILTFGFAFMGAILGWACGFYAPPSEPTNPLKSRFVRIAAAQILWVWFVACLFILMSAEGFYYLFNGDLFSGASARRLYSSSGTIALLALNAIALTLFAFSLWRGVNCALGDAAKTAAQ